MRRKMLSIFLAAMMFLSLFPVGASATETDHIHEAQGAEEAILENEGIVGEEIPDPAESEEIAPEQSDLSQKLLPGADQASVISNDNMKDAGGAEEFFEEGIRPLVEEGPSIAISGGWLVSGRIYYYCPLESSNAVVATITGTNITEVTLNGGLVSGFDAEQNGGRFTFTLYTGQNQVISATDDTGTNSVQVSITAGHKSNGDVWNKSYPATCTEDAYEAIMSTCEICGLPYRSVYRPSAGTKKGHTWEDAADNEGWKDVAQVSECLASGTLQQRTCSTCGFVEQQVKDGDGTAATHLWNQELTTEKSTCTTNGVSYQECERCGAVNPESVTVIPATGHDWGEWTQVTQGKVPDCTAANAFIRERECKNGCQTKDRETFRYSGHTFTAEDDGNCETGIACDRCETFAVAPKSHVWSAQYLHNDQYHWKVCTNAGCTQTSGELPHEREESGSTSCTNDVLCSECSYVIEKGNGQHNFEQGWSHDDGAHWHACQNRVAGDAMCAVRDSVTEHSPEEDDRNCETPLHCEVCSEVLIPAKTHDFADAEYEYDNAQHWHLCQNEGCKQTDEKTDHVPSESADDFDCTTPVYCKECHKVLVVAESSHLGSPDGEIIWEQAPEGHYAVCLRENCQGHYAEGPHVPEADDGDCETPILCEVCGYEMTPASVHVFDNAAYEYIDETQHAQTCQNEGCDVKQYAPHNYTADDDCTTEETCEDCKQVVVRAKQHDFGGKWLYDGVDGHYQACRNEGCEKTSSPAQHEQVADDGDCTTAILCSVCGYEMIKGEAQHVASADSAWKTNASEHWKACENANCTQKVELQAHTPQQDDGDCQTAIHCGICGAETTPAKEHDFGGDWLYDGADGHYQACRNEGCEKTSSPAQHEQAADDGDCMTPILCEICGYEMVAGNAQHAVPADDHWETSDSEHWKICENANCIQKVAVGRHDFGDDDDGDCTTPDTCEVCGYLQHALEHDFTGEWIYNDEGHQRLCANHNCTVAGPLEAHETDVADDGDCTTPILCECGYELVAAKEHDFGSQWLHDDAQHWKACLHDGCEAIDAQTQAEHTYEEGICTVCGAVEPNRTPVMPAPEPTEPGQDAEQPPKTEVPQTGDHGYAVLWIALMSVWGMAAAMLLKRKRNMQ